MMNLFLLFLIILSGFCFISGTSSFGNEMPIMEDILISSKYIGNSIDINGAQSTVITRDDIVDMNICTLPELLDTVASINLIERGTPGSQADISIRGSSIEGVSLFINGVRILDPQTGHFMMDIPLELSSIEKVEVISGGAVLSGSSASGGMINIITTSFPRGVNGSFGIGSFGTIKGTASLSGQRSGANASLTIHGGKSDGYRKSSDLEYSGAHTQGMYTGRNLAVDLNIGFLAKRFGAGDFYAPYPSFEKTATFNGIINTRFFINDNQMVRVRIGSRGHGDDFILIRKKPEVYRNTHYNRSYTIEAEYLRGFRDIFSLMMGVGIERLGITSPSLGNHADYNCAIYSKLLSHIHNSQFSLSLRFNRNYRDESILSPGLGVVIPFGDNNRFRFRAEKSFRSPTYTELYYISPTNVGDPLLKSEHSLSLETGIDLTVNSYSTGITCFARKASNVIDWICYPKETTWSVANHGRLFTSGLETKLIMPLLSSWKMRFHASLLNQSVSERKGIVSKYALNPLGKTLVTHVSGPLFPNMKGVFSARYEKILRGQARIPVTVKASQEYKNVKMIFIISNLFNEHYEELPELRAPGRCFNFDLEYTL